MVLLPLQVTAGNPNLPDMACRAFKVEESAWKILEHEGYVILYQPRNEIEKRAPRQWDQIHKTMKLLGKTLIPKVSQETRIREQLDTAERWMKEGVKLTTIYMSEGVKLPERLMKRLTGEGVRVKISTPLVPPSYIDYFCKKGKSYFLIDVKHKTYSSSPRLNRFRFTNFEVLNYSRIEQEGKVKVKILVVLERERRFYYKMFDWRDFVISSNYDPHKIIKADARLREGLNVELFKEIELEN
jgi:hypothetical protein